jgi:chemosensory pili system protein ChpA (sensor histidine kinase/response regulator)
MRSAHLSHQSLQWTRPLLDELCEEVREALERYAGEPSVHQADELDGAIAACEKVAGSLAIMQFDSGRLFAEAMGVALAALQQGKSSDPDVAVSKLLEATAILPDFLDYLESTQTDSPLVVLPSVNDLRITAGADPLDEAEFFRPPLDSVELPEPAEPSASPAGLRRDYQHALRGILINSEDFEALDKLADITLKVRDQNALPIAVRRAGWAAAAVCEALKNRKLDGGQVTTRLFARMDVMLKEAAENGESAGLAGRADDLTRGLLLQVATAGSDSPIAGQVHAAFNLAEQIPEQVIQAKVYLAGRNRGLLSAVTLAAREDLARIKDALGTQLERENDPTVLREQTAMLESVGESLAMVGLDRLAARVGAQAERLANLDSAPDDPTLLRVARELLIVESQLEESFGLASTMDKEVEDDTADSLLPPTERRRVVRQLVKEALEDLAHAKHLLDAVNRQKADVDSIGEAQTILDRIAGALHVADLDRAAILVEASGRIAGDHLGKTPEEGDREALDALAETLTVTEFYLESRNSSDERGERYLDSARSRLLGLGYWPEPDDELISGATDAPVPADIEKPEPAITDTSEPDDESTIAFEAADDEPTISDPDTDDALEDLDFGELAEPGETVDEIESDADESELRLETEGHLDEALDLPDEAREELGDDSHDAPGPDRLLSDDEDLKPTVDVETDQRQPSDEDLSSAFDDFDIVEIFLEEFDAELESLETLVPRWQENPTDEEDTTTIRRAFHSLKGSGRMADAGEIGEFSWQIENLLNRVLENQIEPDSSITSLVTLAVAALPSMRARLSGEGEAEYDEQACAEIALRAEQLAEGEPATEDETEAVTAPELEGLDPTLIELMVKELSDNLESLEDWLAEAAERDHVEVIDERMVRVVHTMKGTMRLAPIGDEAETAQILEAYLEELQLCGAPPSSAGLTAMAHCADLFRSRLHRLQGDEVDDEKFQTGELADELRALHNKAHRDRTGEHAPSFSPLPPAPEDRGRAEAPDEGATTPVDSSLEDSDEDLAAEDFSSDFDGGTVPDTRDDDFDVFDVDDEAVTAEEDAPEQVEGDAQATEPSQAESAEIVEEALDDEGIAEDEALAEAEAVDEADEPEEAAETEALDEAEAPHEAVEVDETDQLDEAAELVEAQEPDESEVPDEAVEFDEAEELDEEDAPVDDERSEDDIITEEDLGEDGELDEEGLTLAEDLVGDEPVTEAEESDEQTEAASTTEDEVLVGETERAERAEHPDDEVPVDDEPVDEREIEEPEEAASGTTERELAEERASLDSEFVPERYEQPAEPAVPDSSDEGVVHVDYGEVNEDLLEAFLEEGQELLEHSDGLLQSWREEPTDKNLVTALQRDLHTIKGSSRMVGLNPIGQVAHFMEELLEGIATGLKEPTQDRIDSLEAGCDQLNSMIEAVVKREPMPMHSLDELFAERADEVDDGAILPEVTQRAEGAAQADDDTVQTRVESLRVPASLIDELVNYAGEISIFRSRLEQQVSIFRNNVGEVDETVIRLRDQLRKLEIETEAQILARYEREHGPADADFDPLELDRYSTIQQLSRGLSESVNDLTSLTSILDDATRQSETLLMQQSRVNTELQEGLMQARMVSFNTLLPRFRRVVRNASREVGKKVQVEFDLSGESELDRNVLDRITAPLEHLLRNAVSHGIEEPDSRRDSGKPETGTITIEVAREATELVMRVKDDGRGLDLDAIEKRARERGLLKPGEETTDRALVQMIFHSGFTTASEVSELSGRGIGMDVVANEVRQIGGSVSAETEPGRGALFIIRIPLSLTVMQAIMVRASDRSFAIPLQAVRGVTRVLADEWLREIESSEPSQDYAGERYPLLELEPQLDLDHDEISGGTLSLLMIEAGEQRAALRVGELLGHREIVIKPVGPQISSIPGILGGTITADGQVIPILDMGPLIRRAFALDLIPGLGATREAETTQEVKRTPLVLVVDDSITMRRVTSRVLEHRGLEVTTARDGLDAVEAMFERVPDLILLDIEMPRMDGYELASHVRNDPRLKDVPMMMITSRSGEKHRQRARDLGVNDYLAKPYQESELVQHVFDLLQTTVPEE